MTDDNKIEEPAEQERQERRAYEAPSIRDFFQPLVVLGTPQFQAGICPTLAGPRPPSPAR